MTPCKHAILLLRHSSHGLPTILQRGSSLACLHLLACVSWNEAHKQPKLTEAFPRAGEINQFTEYSFLSVLSAFLAT